MNYMKVKLNVGVMVVQRLARLPHTSISNCSYLDFVFADVDVPVNQLIGPLCLATFACPTRPFVAATTLKPKGTNARLKSQFVCRFECAVVLYSSPDLCMLRPAFTFSCQCKIKS